MINCKIGEGKFGLWVSVDEDGNGGGHKFLIRGDKLEIGELVEGGENCPAERPVDKSPCEDPVLAGDICWYDYHCCDITIYFCFYKTMVVCTKSGWVTADLNMSCPSFDVK